MSRRREVPDQARAPEAFLPLTSAVFQILLALADRERHGYALMREIGVQTGGAMRVGPGTLYRSLKQLLAEGLVEEAGDRADPVLDDERRRYYRLTELGRRVAAAEAERLTMLVDAARTKRLLPRPRMAVSGGRP
jgi:DNA-binding PadR family transcriptional regulator